MITFILNVLLISSGLLMLVVFLDLFLKAQVPKWADNDFLFFSVKLGTIRATMQGEEITGFYSNLEKGYVNKETGELVQEGKNPEELSFWRGRYGAEFKWFQRMKELKIILKEGADNAPLVEKVITAGSLFYKSSYLGEVFEAETKDDKVPIQWRYRITVKVTKPKKTFSLDKPHVMLDSAVVSAITDFTRIKTVDELFKITVEGVEGLQIKADKEKVRSEILNYIVGSLNSNEVGNESMSEKLGLEITDFNLIQLTISNPEIAAAMQEKLHKEKEMEAEVEAVRIEAEKKSIESKGDLDAAENKVKAFKKVKKAEMDMLRTEVNIYSKGFGRKGGSLAYLAKNNKSIKALGGGVYSEVEFEDEGSGDNDAAT